MPYDGRFFQKMQDAIAVMHIGPFVRLERTKWACLRVVKVTANQWDSAYTVLAGPFKPWQRKLARVHFEIQKALTGLRGEYD